MVLVIYHLALCTPNVIFEFSHLIVYFPVSLEKADKIFKIFDFINKLARVNSSTKLDEII